MLFERCAPAFDGKSLSTALAPMTQRLPSSEAQDRRTHKMRTICLDIESANFIAGDLNTTACIATALAPQAE
jgi:hypothetical protein